MADKKVEIPAKASEAKGGENPPKTSGEDMVEIQVNPTTTIEVSKADAKKYEVPRDYQPAKVIG